MKKAQTTAMGAKKIQISQRFRPHFLIVLCFKEDSQHGCFGSERGQQSSAQMKTKHTSWTAIYAQEEAEERVDVVGEKMSLLRCLPAIAVKTHQYG